MRDGEMGRKPCCEKVGLKRGAWTAQEDQVLIDYIKVNGEGKWRDLPKRAGLQRCGKSCRLRWLNYLDPRIMRGNITPEEENVIITLHRHLGNRWAMIAGRLPGRTDNEIKNYWNTILYKKVQGQYHFSPPPKRKSRRMSNVNKSIQPPDLVLPTSVTFREASTVSTHQSVHSQDSNIGFLEGTVEAPLQSDDVMTDTGFGETSVADMDKYLQFLLNEDITSLSWDEDVYTHQETSSMHAFSSDDSYWRAHIYVEPDNSFDLGSLATLFESPQWP